VVLHPCPSGRADLEQASPTVWRHTLNVLARATAVKRHAGLAPLGVDERFALRTLEPLQYVAGV